MKKSFRFLFKLLGAATFLGLVMWLGGLFAQPGIAPGVLAAPSGEEAPPYTSLAERVQHTVDYRAVGTLASKSRVQVTARISGQLLQLGAQVGDSVKRGDLLAVIDSRDITSRVEQARSGLLAAEAQEVQAAAALKRVRELLAAQAATPAQLEAAEAAAASAKASVAAARERILEAEVSLGYARITAPMDGIIADRPVDPGDTAWPGAPLFTLLDPTDLRIEAWVRESALEHIEVGAVYSMQVPSRNLELEATVDEIVPSADPRSRSFLVRASFPAGEGLHPGMFARLVIEVGKRDVIEVESAAVRRIGQLDTVLVKGESRWLRRYITTGKTAGAKTEVLSGLAGGETIGWSE